MIRAIIAFLATVLTAVQVFSHYFGGQAICFNNGCAVVDSMTTVPPLYFNIVGFVYFLILFCCLLWGRDDGAEHWHKFARLLLLAGLASEAVLLFFQYSIATVFCSYCSIIFAIILLLNILSGPRQIFRGLVLFSAVIVVCFSLRFRVATGSGGSLDEGSMAMVRGTEGKPQLYLFFSSTCPHCEKVMEILKEENNCSVRFNPIERIDSFSFPEHQSFVDYQPEINLNFMTSLSLTEIPVLVAREQSTLLVLKGGGQISQYLAQNCQETEVAEKVEKVEKSEQVDYSGGSSMLPRESTDYTGFSEIAVGGDDACGVGADCEPEVTGDTAATNN